MRKYPKCGCLLGDVGGCPICKYKEVNYACITYRV